MSALTVRARDVRNFVTSDERLTEGGWEMALTGGWHRDASALATANAQEILARLEAVDPEHEAHDTMRASHWAVGWYEHLIVNPAHAEVMRVLEECRASLDEYPSLNDDRFSALEFEWHSEERCGEGCPFEHCRKCGDGLYGDEPCERCTDE